MEYLRRNGRETIVTKDNNLVQSCQRILDAYFSEYIESEIKKVTDEEITALEK